MGWKVGDFEGRGADFLEGGGRPGLRPVLPLVAQRIEVRSQRADSYLIPSPPTAVRQRHQSLSPTSRTPPTPDRTTSPVTRSGTSYREKQKQKSWAKPSRAKHGSCLREAEAAAPSAPGLRPVLPSVAQRTEIRNRKSDSYLIPSPPAAVRQRHQALSPTSRTPPTPDRNRSPGTGSGAPYREKQEQKAWAKPGRAKHGSCLREAEAAAPSAPGLRPALPLVAQRTEIRSRKSDSYLFSLRSYQSSAVAPNPAPNLPRPPDLR